MDVLDSAHDGADKVGGIGLGVVYLGADAVEKLATGAEVEDEVEIVRGFKIVVEGYDVRIASGNMLKDGNFIANLEMYRYDIYQKNLPVRRPVAQVERLSAAPDENETCRGSGNYRWDRSL
jgi:hypothetical protein